MLFINSLLAQLIANSTWIRDPLDCVGPGCIQNTRTDGTAENAADIYNTNIPEGVKKTVKKTCDAGEDQSIQFLGNASMFKCATGVFCWRFSGMELQILNLINGLRDLESVHYRAKQPLMRVEKVCHFAA